MAYLSSKNRNRENSGKTNGPATRNYNSETMYVNNRGVNNGYQNLNNYNQNNRSDNRFRNRMSNMKERQTKENTKRSIEEGLKDRNSISSARIQSELNGLNGSKLTNAYEKGSTHEEGMVNVEREIVKKDVKNIIKILALFLVPILIILFLAILMVTVFKNADSQIFSNVNGGTVQSDDYQFEDKDLNIFKNYPGLYEKIMKLTQEVSVKYQIEIDKFLVIATLVAPIENGLIIPVNDGSCGEPNCYYFKGESKTWTEFLDAWGDQSELLSKMQMLTFTNPASSVQVECGEEETLEQYAKNDLETNVFPWWGWLNPANWFKGFRDANAAEVNAKCTEAPSGKTKVPTVETLSTERGEHYLTNNEKSEYEYIKEPNSGGVYFWNLLNKNGFIHEYLKDYLSDQYKDDEDKNYEVNKAKILEVTDYIYSYYDSIRKDCEGHKIIESSIDKIKVYNPPEKQSRFGLPETIEIDFEDQYIGGVMLAEYNSGGEESLKAFAILARTEAVAVVGLDGAKTIENSSNVQNYNPNYSPEKYPRIAKAVEETRGLVVSHFQDPKVWHTEYDAFCPVKNVLEDGFYYLDDEQQNLPINPAAYEARAHKEFINPDSEYLDCPCFQNNNSRPHDEDAEDKNTRYYKSNTEPPTFPGGTPSQETKAVCWKPKGTTKTDDEGNTLYGWKYKPTGGHGRGASQYGLKYFDVFGYDQDALIRMFFPGAAIRVLSSSLEDDKCNGIPYYTGEPGGGTGTGNGTSDNYTDVIGGTPFNSTLAEALAQTGHTIADLNACICNRTTSAGLGTRAAVVEAGMGLLQCTMDMTGGFTYPYDHYGGAISSANPDISGKMGVNSRWGQFGGTGCATPPCRLGLNCATFVRWSMCNGGMNLCSRGSTFAHEMYGTQYFPGAIKIRLGPGFKVLEGNTSISSADEAFNNIQPGDVLYSDRLTGGGNHVMLIVGKDSSGITIAENGRKTRRIAKNELISSSTHTYGLLLLDGFYADASNKTNLTCSTSSGADIGNGPGESGGGSSGGSSYSPNGSPVTNKGSGSYGKIESSKLDSILKRGDVASAQVATFSNGSITGTYNYNSSDNEEYIISAASKTVLGIIAAKMQEEGIINLDTSLDQYWHKANGYDYSTCSSEWRIPLQSEGTLRSYTQSSKNLVENKASLRNCLTHSSTIKNLSMIYMVPGDTSSEYFGGGMSKTYGRAAFMLAHTSHQLFNAGATPGRNTEFNYQEDSLTREHALAGFTMQIAMKISVNEYLRSKILSPLGASASAFANGNSIYFATSYKTSAVNLAKIIAAVANDGVYEGKTIFSKATVDNIEKVESNLKNQTIAFNYINGKYVKYGFYKSVANASYYGVGYTTGTFISYDPKTSSGIVVNVKLKSSGDHTKSFNEIFNSLLNY